MCKRVLLWVKTQDNEDLKRDVSLQLSGDKVTQVSSLGSSIEENLKLNTSCYPALKYFVFTANITQVNELDVAKLWVYVYSAIHIYTQYFFSLCQFSNADVNPSSI